MGKVWTFITINIGLALLLLAAGITIDSGGFLNFFGLAGSTGINTSSFFTKVGTLLALTTGASIIIGLFGRTSPEFAFKAPFAAENLLIFLGTFVGIMKYINNGSFSSWISWVVFVIFSVLTVGFTFSLVEWTFGSDN